jgi:hypothetical protein
VQQEVDRLEKAARQLIPKRAVLGAARAMQVPPESRITSYEPKQQLIPRFAFGRGATMKTRMNAIANMKTFRRLYQEAWAKWRRGDRDVEFPAGTYAMRVKHKVRVAAEHSSHCNRDNEVATAQRSRPIAKKGQGRSKGTDADGPLCRKARTHSSTKSRRGPNAVPLVASASMRREGVSRPKSSG